MKRLVFTLTLLFSCLAAASAQVDIKVQAPNLVGVSEQFNVVFVVADEQPSSIEWNPGEDFRLVWGPQRGQSSSTTIINGKRSSSKQFSFSYIVEPLKEGTFTLPAARLTVKGKEYSSGNPKIEVVADSDKSSSSSSSAAPSSSSRTEDVSSDDLFIKLSLSKRNVMVGEPLEAQLKLYKRANIVGFDDVRFPEFQGFWSNEHPRSQQLQFQRENVDGKIYETAVLSSWTLIPQKAGELTIDKAELVCLVNIRVQRPSTGSILDSFFQDDYQTIRKRVSSPAIKVNVKSLPAGAPSSFGGGVGKYSMNASLSCDSLKTHDAASLIIKITGSGNTALITAPAISFPADFECYDVKTTDIPGGKQFEYPFIPRSWGEFNLGPVEYSYWDTSEGRYVVLKSSDLPLKVLKSESDSAAGGDASYVRENRGKDVKTLGSDIRYINTSLPSFKDSGRGFLLGSLPFWILLCTMLVFGAGVYFTLRYLRSRREDVVQTKTRKATKMARKRLAMAGSFLQKGLNGAFYEAMHKALLGYVSDKLNMDASQLSRENIAQRLQESGLQKSLCDEFISLLDECEYARYSPDNQNDTMNANYNRALSLISAMDSAISTSNKSRTSGSKLSVLLLLCFLGSFSLQAREHERADSLWNAGVEQYSQGLWMDAASSWEQCLEQGYEAKELYYNLGNAYLKADYKALSVLNYERALKLDPSYSDASYNLELVRSGLQDRIDQVPEFFLSTWMRSVRNLLSPDAWTVLALVMVAIFIAGLLLFLLSRRTSLRKTGFISAIVSLLLCITGFSMALTQTKAYSRHDRAVVTSPVLNAVSAPSDSGAKALFVLHEGTCVKILDSVGKYTNISLSDGRQGWVVSDGIEII